MADTKESAPEFGKKCAQCNKSLKKTRRYYRNGNYYCNKNCFKNKTGAAEKTA